MKIFYYTWHENTEQDMAEGLMRLGHEVVKCYIPLKNYEEDEEFTQNLERIFLEQECEMFITFNFFPIIAKTAHKMKKRYVAWTYDMPQYTIFSPSVQSEYVSIFLFDRAQYLRLKKIKPTNIYYQPLAVNTERLEKLLGEFSGEVDYQDEISFVGGLYENTLYRQVRYLPEYLKGYIEGIINAQQTIYGYNLVADVLTDEVVGELEKYINMNMDNSYFITNKELYADMINQEITGRERSAMLVALAQNKNVKLYTGSDMSLVPGVQAGGTVAYGKEMPKIFRNSKINLNITLRSIESGIPLRALDVMGAGGFLLSNYQPELAEYFVNGEEMVMFESREDLVAKATYYLKHEEERKRIAYQGYKKVREQFSYGVQLQKILELV